MGDMMTTREVAEYLRIKERKVYDLVKARRIPCTRVTGKWLFPRPLIDAWVSQSAAVTPPAPAPPAVVAGTHDPLLEWCLNQAGAGLAMLPGGSLHGIERLATGDAAICALHVRDLETGEYNLPLVRQSLGALGVVVVEWAWREQGLVVAEGNPKDITAITDLPGVRIATRQAEAGSHILFEHLLSEAGLTASDLDGVGEPARSESELAMMVLEGKADVGLAVAAVAHKLKLGFVPLYRERCDLVIRRRDYFEAPFQTLLAFTRTAAFTSHAADLGGYDISGLGTVLYNSP